MKIYEKMKKHAWIVLATAIAVFVAIVFTVYYVAAPRNLSKIAYNSEDYNKAWELMSTDQNVENNSVLTQVYSCTSDESDMNLNLVNFECSRSCVVESESAEHNYRVEIYIRILTDNKECVKRVWNETHFVTDTDKSNIRIDDIDTVWLAHAAKAFGDIQKEDVEELFFYEVFLRVIVKPGYTVNIICPDNH